MPPSIPSRASCHAGPDQAPHAGHAHPRRDRAPRAARPPLAHRARAAALRHHARRRLHGGGEELPERARDHRRARHADLQGGRRAHQRARARPRPTTASARATASRSCAATTAAGSTPCSPARKLGANALFLNTAFSGPQLTDVAKREKPKAIIYDHEFAEVLKDAERAAQALRRLARARGRQGQRPAPGGPDRARGHRAADAPRSRAARSSSPPARPARRRARPLDAEVDRPDRLAAVGDPAARAREDDDRRAAVSRLGLRAVGARASASPRRSCSSASSTRRRRSR